MIKFTLFFLSLSLLIILHEFGHYITARWFKAKVDKFYLFFDFLFPFPGVMKFSLFKKKIGDTEYGLGWFPFGGYVDIAGMMADPEEKEPKAPEPHEFRGKKPWQRLIILAGGVTVNFLLAIVIYSMLAWAWGDDRLPAANAKYGVMCDTIMLNMGLQDGDKPIAVDGVPIDDIQHANASMILDDHHGITVERDGKTVNIPLKEGIGYQVIEKEDQHALFQPLIPFVADSVIAGDPAEKAGLQKGDSIVTLNNDTLPMFQQFAAHLSRFKDKKVTVGFYRNGKYMTAEVNVNKDGKMGVAPADMDRYLTFVHTDYNFFPAWGRGFSRTTETLSNYVKQLKFLFTKAGAKKVGGFGSIGKLFPSTWNWEAFWEITAMLSVILAFMNLLPIPVLDGGYILFVLWEMITGKKVSDKFMQKALTIGMYFVLALLLYANGNDIFRALTK